MHIYYGRIFSNIVFIGIMLLSSGYCFSKDYTPHWSSDGKTLTYGTGLPGQGEGKYVDEVEGGEYEYCRWGNVISDAIPLTDDYVNYEYWCPFNDLTEPFDTQNIDSPSFGRIFAVVYDYDTNSFKRRMFSDFDDFDLNISPGENSGDILLYEKELLTLKFCRYFTFAPHNLEVDHTEDVGDIEKCIILLHGWNPESDNDAYDSGCFKELYDNLKQQLSYSTWHVLKYHMEKDTDTGDNDWYDLHYNAIRGTRAAEVARLHGYYLGELLLNVKKVHLIAHSAGSWAARSCLKYLLCESQTLEKIQVTLLDPFVPGRVPLISSNLDVAQMEKISTFPDKEKIYWVENYYSAESNDYHSSKWVLGTQGDFAWDGVPHINQDTEDYNIGDWYDHDGPIKFYADSIMKDSFYIIGDLGWRKSLAYQDLISWTIKLYDEFDHEIQNNSNNITRGTDLILKFNKYVSPELSASYLTLTCTESETIEDFDFFYDSNSIIINPHADFKPGEKVTLTLKRDAVVDQFGNTMPNDFIISFNINAPPPPTSINISCLIDPVMPLHREIFTLSGSAYYDNGEKVKHADCIITFDDGDVIQTNVEDGQYSITHLKSGIKDYIATVNIEDENGISGTNSITFRVDNNIETGNNFWVLQSFSPTRSFYNSGHEQAKVTATFNDISDRCESKMKWFRPGGAFDQQIVGPDVGSIDYWWYWTALDVRTLPGEWTVKLYVKKPEESRWTYVSSCSFIMRFKVDDIYIAKNHELQTPYSPINESNILKKDDDIHIGIKVYQRQEPIKIIWEFVDSVTGEYLNSFQCSEPDWLEVGEDTEIFWYTVNLNTFVANGGDANLYKNNIIIRPAFDFEGSYYYVDDYSKSIKILESPAVSPESSFSVSTIEQPEMKEKQIKINFSVTDNNHVKKVILHWNKNILGSKMWDNIYLNNFTTEHIITNLSEGEGVAYWIEAWDTSGNYLITETQQYTFHSIPPQCTVEAEKNNPGLSDGKIKMSLSCSDNVELQKVTLNWNYGKKHSYTWDDINSSTFNQSYVIGPFPNFAKIEYWVEAWDSANTSYTSNKSLYTVHCDKDNDGLTDYEEYNLMTNLLSSDSDNDGMSDGWEVLHNFNPLDITDATYDNDSDSLTNYEEFMIGTNPFNKDSDNDELTDNDEITYSTSPTDIDTDHDGFRDVYEIFMGTSPLNDLEYPIAQENLFIPKTGINPDLNGDGYPDIIISCTGEKASVLFFGSSSGFSDSNRKFFETDLSTSNAIADFNNDDNADVIFCEHNADAPYIYYGQGNGNFSLNNTHLISTQTSSGVSIADLNEDKFIDLVISNNNGNTDSYIYWGSDTNYRYSINNRTLLPTQHACGNAIADLNGDGYLDIIFCNNNGNGYSYIYWGSENGYSINHRKEIPTQGAISVSVADLDDDWYLDLVFANCASSNSYIYWGDEAGNFDSARSELPTFKAMGSAIGDLDCDGDLDLVFCNGVGDIMGTTAYIYLNNNDRFSTLNKINIGTGETGARGCILYDLDNNGYLDIIFATQRMRVDGAYENRTTIYYGAANLNYTPSYLTSNRASCISVGDKSSLGQTIHYNKYFDHHLEFSRVRYGNVSEMTQGYFNFKVYALNSQSFDSPIIIKFPNEKEINLPISVNKNFAEMNINNSLSNLEAFCPNGIYTIKNSSFYKEFRKYEGPYPEWIDVIYPQDKKTTYSTPKIKLSKPYKYSVEIYNDDELIYYISNANTTTFKIPDGIFEESKSYELHFLNYAGPPSYLGSKTIVRFEVKEGSDFDNDGIPDKWEDDNRLDLFDDQDATLDYDNDALINYEEFCNQTDPYIPDTDNDGINDGWEVSNNLNPLLADNTLDPDNDGLSNYEEFIHDTNPLSSDTDNDGIPDNWEIANNLNPKYEDNLVDNDNDGLLNYDEFILNTSPLLADTDNDGLDDADESLSSFTNPVLSDLNTKIRYKNDFLTLSEHLCINDVNDDPLLWCGNPTVSYARKNFLVVWEQKKSNEQDSIYARIITQEGEFLDQFKINSVCPGNYPSVSSNGNIFLVVWKSINYGIYGCLLDYNGNIIKSEFLISSWENIKQSDPCVIAGTENYFLTVWEIADTKELIGQLIDTKGDMLGNQFIITSNVENHPSPHLIVHNNNYILVWVSNNLYSLTGIVINPSDDNPLSNSFPILDPNIYDEGRKPWLSCGKNNFLAIFEDWIVDGDYSEIFGQFLGRDFSPSGSKFLINTQLESYQEKPQIYFNGSYYLALWINQQKYHHPNFTYLLPEINGQVLHNSGQFIGYEMKFSPEENGRNEDFSLAGNRRNYLLIWKNFTYSTGDNIYGAFLEWGYKTNPLKADSDDDGLKDGDEILTYNTNPLLNDTDNDGYADGLEIFYSTDPSNKESIPTVELTDDLNGDNYPDILLGIGWCGGSTPPSRICYGDHSNSYSIYKELESYNVYGSAIADLNSDGYQDIILGTSVKNSQHVTQSFIYWGDSSHSYSNKTKLTTQGALGISVADLNQDGYLDIIFSNSKDGTQHNYNSDINSYIYWGDQSYTYSNKTELATHGARGNEIADINQDGYLDIVFCNTCSGSAGNLNFNVASYIYWGDENASYSQRTEVETNHAADVAIGDLNKDGYIDLVFSRTEYSGNVNIDSYIFWGDITYSYNTKLALETHMASVVNIADLDKNGYMDIVFSNCWDGVSKEINSYIYWGNESSDYSNRTGLPTIGAEAHIIKDMNNDGLLDIVFANDLDAYVYWNDSSHSFNQKTEISLNGNPGTISVGNISSWGNCFILEDNDDYDHDGMPNKWEIQNGLNPLWNDANGDLDNDSILNCEEFQIGTSSNNPDSDNDGMNDGWENKNNLNCLYNDALEDNDNDGLNNLQEFTYHTDPSLSDSDNDGMNDGDEIKACMEPDNADSLFAINDYRYKNGQIILQWQGSTSNPDLTYQIFWRDSLNHPWKLATSNFHDIYHHNSASCSWFDIGNIFSIPSRSKPKSSLSRYYKVLVGSQHGLFENMIYIPAGVFIMGNTFNDDYANEEPEHTVYLDAYYIDKYEVSNAEYVIYLNDAKFFNLIEYSNGIVYQKDSNIPYFNELEYEEINFLNDRFYVVSGYENLPVRYVSWYGANDYAQYVGKRLPTEAEWEKAAIWNPITNSKRRYSFDDDLNDLCCNYNNYYGAPTIVGWFDGSSSLYDAQSYYGCYDMSGNVWEWVHDWYSLDYYESCEYQNPKGPSSGSARVRRGGYWGSTADYVRGTVRSSTSPDIINDFGLGFRCAKSADKMVYIPAGSFVMGNTFNDDYADEEPEHTVYLNSYYIDRYEVTNAEFVAYLNYAIENNFIELIEGIVYQKDSNIPYFNEVEYEEINFLNDRFYVVSGYESYPVRYVSWYGANAYAQFVGKRLPTEAEWEKAAGWNPVNEIKTLYSFGNEINAQLCNHNNYYNGPTAIGNFNGTGGMHNAKSWYGCLDMSGNAWEWVHDLYDSYYYSNSPIENPLGPDNGKYRVLRGGNWSNGATGIRVSRRASSLPSSMGTSFGFRCAKSAN